MRSPSGRLSARKWARLRQDILHRDGYRCRKCGGSRQRGGDGLQVHHIKPVYRHPELSYDERNLETLCRGCHAREHGRPETEWTIYRDQLRREQT